MSSTLRAIIMPCEVAGAEPGSMMFPVGLPVPGSIAGVGASPPPQFFGLRATISANPKNWGGGLVLRIARDDLGLVQPLVNDDDVDTAAGEVAQRLDVHDLAHTAAAAENARWRAGE